MAQFEPLKAEFDQQKAKVWFIAAEKRHGIWSPEKFFETHPLSFPFLLDEDRAVTKAYGVYQRLGVDAINIARPATFVVGADRKIRFLYVGQSQVDRLPMEQVLRAVAQNV